MTRDMTIRSLVSQQVAVDTRYEIPDCLIREIYKYTNTSNKVLFLEWYKPDASTLFDLTRENSYILYGLSRRLIEKIINNVNNTNANRENLSYAVRHNRLDIVKKLTDKGLQPDRSEFHLACFNNNVEMLKQLNKANPKFLEGIMAISGCIAVCYVYDSEKTWGYLFYTLDFKSEFPGEDDLWECKKISLMYLKRSVTKDRLFDLMSSFSDTSVDFDMMEAIYSMSNFSQDEVSELLHYALCSYNEKVIKWLIDKYQISKESLKKVLLNGRIRPYKNGFLDIMFPGIYEEIPKFTGGHEIWV